jgi:FKBP-type peptidyl-prolyl cis-trans isomerase 2
VFANREGVAYDAGASLVTGNFGVIAGATKVVHELTKTITGAQAGDALSISLAAAAGLANDDLLVHSVWISVR